MFINFKGKTLSVECAFQGSKVFFNQGPFHDLYHVSSIEAKKDIRLKNSGNLISFNFFGIIFPTQPLTAFYDWLYFLALSQNPALVSGLSEYHGFSDIAFNPEKSINCQARSAALFIALSKSKYIEMGVFSSDIDYYFNVINPRQKWDNNKNFNQLSLF